VGRFKVEPLLAVILGAVTGATLGAWLAGRVARRSPRSKRRALRHVLCAALVAAGVLYVGRPFQLTPLRWTLAQCAEAGRSPRPISHLQQWGQIRRQVFELHASNQPADSTQPWRHRLEADTSYLCALGSAGLSMEVTQPRGAVTDPATGQRRADANGVTCRLETWTEGQWTTAASVVLDEQTTEWKSLVAEIAQGTTRVALALDARGSLSFDAVCVSMLPPQASTLLGVSLMPVLRLGEFLVIWLFVLALVLGLERFFVVCSRVARVPTVSAAPGHMATPPAVRAALLVVLLAAPLALALPVAPWLEALVTPVLISWDAPEGTPLEVHFGPAAEDRVPGIRIDDSTWRADLPPRPSYQLALVLPRDYAERNAVPSELRLLDHRTGSVFASTKVETLRRVPVPSSADAGPRTEPASERLRLECDQEFTTARSSLGEHTFFLWLGGFVVLSVLALTATLLLRKASTHAHGQRVDRTSVRPILLAGLAAAVIACVCVLRTPPRMTEDSYLYLSKGYLLTERGTLDTGMDGVEAVRTPGYPGWLAAAIKIVGADIDAITIGQTLFFVGALVFLALSLRGMVRTRWLVAGVLLGSWSPTQQHFMRDLMSESVFVSLCLVALGCHFFARSSSRLHRTWWLGAAALATAGAMLTRVNAAALLAAPALLWTACAAALWRSEPTVRAAAKSIARMSVPYVSIAIVIPATLFVWSYRNYKTCGYFGISSMVALSDMQGEVQTGMLDPRVLERRGFYPSYVRTKMARSGEWSSWFIQEALFQRAYTSGLPPREHVAFIEQQFAEMVAESNAALPPAARLVKFIRATWWNFQFAPTRDFVQSQVLEDFSQWGTVSAADYARTMRETLQRDAGITVILRDPDLGSLGESLLSVRRWYAHVDCPLLVLAFAAACWLLARGQPILAMPFFFVLANFALLSYLRQQEWRYMGVMDVFLILQLVIAVGVTTRGPSKKL
jgi:hypothetical protein